MKNGIELSFIFFGFALISYFGFENFWLGFTFVIIQLLFLISDDEFLS